MNNQLLTKSKIIKMKFTDITVYCIDFDHTDGGNLNPSNLTDKQFIDKSIRQSLYYSLPEFEQAFNTANISDQWYIRILKTPTQF